MSRSALGALYAQWRQIAATHGRRVQRARRLLADAHARLVRARAADVAAQRALASHRAARERLAVRCLRDAAEGLFARQALRVNLRDEGPLRDERDAARIELGASTDALAVSRTAVQRAEKRHEAAVEKLDLVVKQLAELREEDE